MASDEQELAKIGVVGEGFLREGKTLVQAKMDYVTAITVQKPRNIVKIQEELLKEADMAGEAFYYSWPVKNKDGTRGIIEGSSVGLASSAGRLWGNCFWRATYVEDNERYYFDGHFVDLETGFNVVRPFRQRKAIVIGKHDKDRKEDIAFQIGASKAMRNVIINGGIPRWLTDKARNQAKNAIVLKFEKVWKDEKKKEETIQRAIAEFDKLKVSLIQLEALMGSKAIWNPQIMAQLYGIAQALKDNQATVEEIFGESAGEQAPDIDQEKFWNTIASLDTTIVIAKVKTWLEKSAEALNVPVEQFMTTSPEEIVKQYKKWLEGQPQPGAEDKGKKELPLRTCKIGTHKCSKCEEPISIGQQYYDGGLKNRFHHVCPPKPPTEDKKATELTQDELSQASAPNITPLTKNGKDSDWTDEHMNQASRIMDMLTALGEDIELYVKGMTGQDKIAKLTAKEVENLYKTVKVAYSARYGGK